MDKYLKVVDLMQKSKNTIVLTGAGISTESGIPDFRSPNSGLWTKVDPMEALSTSVLFNNPQKFYNTGFKIITSMKNAKPNRAHEILAKMEDEGIIQLIITQNIDNLHLWAGSQNVYEVHGNSRSCTCMKCKKTYSIETIEKKVEKNEIPPKCVCSGIIRPDVVLFGDMLPDCFYEGMIEVEKAGLLIVIGSSLTVYPVSQMAAVCKRLIILNFGSTPYDYKSDVVINDNISDSLTKIYNLMRPKDVTI